MKTIASTPEAKEVLTEMADRNQLPGDVSEAMMARLIMASFRAGKQADLESIKEEMISASAKEVQDYLMQMRSGLIWPAGYPGVPTDLVGEWKKPGKGLLGAAREIFNRVLKRYCTDNGLDGVLVVFLASEKGKPGDIRIITRGDRILSSFKVNPTIKMMTAEGKTGFFFGSTRLDDLAPMKLGMPIFIKEKDTTGIERNFRLDLNDPAGKAISGYKELIDKTADKLLKKVLKKLP